MNEKYLIKLSKFNLPIISKIENAGNKEGDIFISFKGIKLLDKYYGVFYFRKANKFENNLKVKKTSLITPVLFCYLDVNEVVDRKYFKDLLKFLKKQGVIIIDDLKGGKNGRTN